LLENIFLNKKLYLLLCFVFCSFKQVDHSKLSNKIYSSYNKELCKKEKLYLVGKGGSMINGTVNKVNAAYISHEKVDIDAARRLFVTIAEGYISRYNQNEQIRPYLCTYPFTIDNFKVRIAFEDKPGPYSQRVGGGYVAFIFNIPGKNRLYYDLYNHETGKFVSLHDESYDTAREIVLAEKLPGN